QPVIRQQKIRVDLRTATDVDADVGLQSLLTNVGRNGEPHDAVTVFTVAREQSHHSNLAGDTAAALHIQPTPFIGVHEARFAADVSFVGFDMAAHLAAALALQSESETRQHET